MGEDVLDHLNSANSYEVLPGSGTHVNRNLIKAWAEA